MWGEGDDLGPFLGGAWRGGRGTPAPRRSGDALEGKGQRRLQQGAFLASIQNPGSVGHQDMGAPRQGEQGWRWGCDWEHGILGKTSLGLT